MSGLLDVKKQFTFYGAYHANPINFAVHFFFVPILLWSGFVIGTRGPQPSFLPEVHISVNDYLAFDLNIPTIYAATTLLYYYALEPAAAFVYTPQMALMILSATKFSYRPNALYEATAIHVASWIAQFLSHLLAEGRAPALLDNLVGAVVLAPFFVHIETLFKFGYNPGLQESLHVSIAEELRRIKEVEKNKKAQ